MNFSIIIPVLNEEQYILPCLVALQHFRGCCEIIVVDGGSSDNTIAIASPLADQVIKSGKGRARQMNAGARLARGDVLVFVHADTYLPHNALELIQERVNACQQWGFFQIQLEGEHFMFKVIAFMMNLRSGLTAIATGDQAIFVSKSAFTSLNGYPEIALMEDISLTAMLGKFSRPVIIYSKVSSSARRWEKHGIFKTILLMWWLRLLYFFGCKPTKLATFYQKGQLWSR
jgi:rSAM/selenodomain-associated transferase 2